MEQTIIDILVVLAGICPFLIGLRIIFDYLRIFMFGGNY